MELDPLRFPLVNQDDALRREEECVEHEARDVLHRSLDFDPEEPWRLACLGYVEKPSGNFLEAEHCFRKARAKKQGVGDFLVGYTGDAVRQAGRMNGGLPPGPQHKC